jgi:hypothetical protein
MLRRLIPSPAMVVALVALFMALGGSAYALVITGASIKNGTVAGRDIKNRSLTGKDMAGNRVGGGAIKESSLGTVPSASLADGVTRYAVVTADGVTARARGVSSVTKINAGRYQVIFDRDVRNCAYFATIGDTGGATPGMGDIATRALGSNVNGVWVQTDSQQSKAADRPFHLIVLCQ